MKRKLIYSALFLFALSLSGCGQPVGDSSNEVPPSIDTKGFNDIAVDSEIHTEAQKEFLEYEGSYAKMPKDLFPNGQSHLSDSLPVTLTWDYALPEGKEIEKFSITFGQEADLHDGYTVEGTSEESLQVYNAYLGTNYYKLLASYTDGETNESPIMTFNVNSCYPRNLTIEGMTNCRDIGGRILENGGKIKQGLIYRTSGKNQNGSLTEKTTEEMVNHLGVKNEINLAGDSDSYNLKLEGVPVYTGSRMDTSSTGGYSHVSRNTEAVKNFFNFISDEDHLPLFYHCKIGTDRTGLCTILLHGLLGASYEQVYQDYLFSNFGKIGEQRTIGDGNSHDIKKYMDDLVNYSGEKFQNKVYNFLLGLGVAKDTLDHIIDMLTEGPKAAGNDAGQIIARADVLEGNGTEMVTDTSERNHPDNYFTLDGTSSVSYSFEAKKAFEGQVVAYLANPDTNQSDDGNKALKIEETVDCEIDSHDITMTEQSYYEARLGRCKLNGNTRINYWPVILGTTSIAQGNHTIEIKGLGRNINIGGIYIFDNSTAGGQNGFEA